MTTVFSLENYYRTQPPQQVGAVKVASVLEYLAFSGTSLYLSVEKKPGNLMRIEQPALTIDVLEDSFILEVADLKTKLECPITVEGAFGYKRKRASFRTTLTKIDGNTLTLAKPATLTLTNLRRNPRVAVDKEMQRKGMSVKLTATTSIGSIEMNSAEIFEMSQLGMSLFISRAEGLLLPGDKIDLLEVSYQDGRILRTAGVVSRVDMKRRSPSMPQSYEIVLLFQNPAAKMHIGEIKRSAKRIPVMDSKPCFFSAEHPFFPGRRMEGQVFEVSTSGLSCLLEKTSFPIIPGMRFKNCSLQLPHRPPREFVFEVAHVEFRSDGTLNQFKLGGEFVSAPVELIKDVSAYSQEAAGGFIQDVSENDLDLLWEFMFETNFIYQNKRRQIQNKSKEILETYHRLLSTDNPIVKKIVFKEDDEIKGHLSGIRFYDQAWIIQHLNALRSNQGSAAQAVLRSMVDFLYDAKAHSKNNIYYVMSFYRPDNLYPSILFGESANRINDKEKCVTHDFSFGLLNESKMEPAPAEGVSVDSPEAIDALVKFLVEKKMTGFLRATGLANRNPLQLDIQNIFLSLNLKRERHILAYTHGESQVIALCEVSSPGLNLSEITNSIYLFADGLNDLEVQTASDALIAEVYRRYYAPLDILPTILQPAGTERATSVTWSKIYTCWILSEKALADFEKASESVLKDIKQLVAQFRGSDTSNDRPNAQSA